MRERNRVCFYKYKVEGAYLVLGNSKNILSNY